MFVVFFPSFLWSNNRSQHHHRQLKLSTVAWNNSNWNALHKLCKPRVDNEWKNNMNKQPIYGNVKIRLFALSSPHTVISHVMIEKRPVPNQAVYMYRVLIWQQSTWHRSHCILMAYSIVLSIKIITDIIILSSGFSEPLMCIHSILFFFLFW